MKNLCRKGKVQVHPSPNPAACRDAYSVLRLLPVAIAALSATLVAEDREVLAYFIARSLDVPDKETKKNKRSGAGGTPRKSGGSIGRNGDADEDDEVPPWAGGGGGCAAAAASSSSLARFAEGETLLRSPSRRGKEVKNSRKAAAPLSQRSHRASFECSCFQCYTSFWSRWDASPRREIIHQAIDLFEEHIAAMAAEAEAAKARKSKKGSKPGKDANNNPKVIINEGKEKDEVFTVFAAPPEGKNERDEDSKPAPRSKQIVPFDFEEENEESESSKAADKMEEVRAGACPLEGRSLMRRMFPDIMGFVADHLWTAWSSPVRASNA